MQFPAERPGVALVVQVERVSKLTLTNPCGGADQRSNARCNYTGDTTAELVDLRPEKLVTPVQAPYAMPLNKMTIADLDVTGLRVFLRMDIEVDGNLRVHTVATWSTAVQGY